MHGGNLNIGIKLSKNNNKNKLVSFLYGIKIPFIYICDKLPMATAIDFRFLCFLCENVVWKSRIAFLFTYFHLYFFLPQNRIINKTIGYSVDVRVVMTYAGKIKYHSFVTSVRNKKKLYIFSMEVNVSIKVIFVFNLNFEIWMETEKRKH